MGAARRSPPRDLDDLTARAEAIRGAPVNELAWGLGFELGGDGARTKGKVGELVERALGANGGSSASHDFPGLGVELKTIPLGPRGVPTESTFVCAIAIGVDESVPWKGSWTRAKLAHVLWVPIVGDGDARTIGAPLLWRPTAEQDAQLGADYDEAMGILGLGGVEGLTARTGRWMQVRPKAPDGKKRATALGPDGEWIATVPKGFYLRARFTSALLRDVTALP
jgi:DNA mismatch repair protein MutH